MKLLIEDQPSDRPYLQIPVNDSLMGLSVHFSSCGVQTKRSTNCVHLDRRCARMPTDQYHSAATGSHQVSSKFKRLFFCNADEHYLMEIQHSNSKTEGNNCYAVNYNYYIASTNGSKLISESLETLLVYECVPVFS